MKKQAEKVSIKNTALFLLFSGLLYLTFSFTLEPPLGWQQQFHTPPGVTLQYLSPVRKSNLVFKGHGRKWQGIWFIQDIF